MTMKKTNRSQIMLKNEEMVNGEMLHKCQGIRRTKRISSKNTCQFPWQEQLR